VRGPRSSQTRELVVFLAGLLGILIYLGVERVRLARAVLRIPVRIAVTGTRGKSGVTRLIAAGMTGSGKRVLAKTTGSRPAWILPDGSEEEIPRSGPPSIREQIRVVCRGARAGADTLVIEMMSLGEECLFTESRRIVRPGTLALTNVRLDHQEAMGRRREDIARTLSAAFPRSGNVFIPEEEMQPVFQETASRLGTRLAAVPAARPHEKSGAEPRFPYEEFEPNIRLALAVLRSLGVDDDAALRGLGRVIPDFGSLRIWRAEFGTPPRPAYCVSAFAANDPESSAGALEAARKKIPMKASSLIGLLNLREDRGDRTLQWVSAAKDGFFGEFECVAVLGSPARAARRKLRKVLGSDARKFWVGRELNPAELMNRIVSSTEREPVIIGLGNIAGPGERIVSYWEEVGRPYGH
jgi:poly-gamma-glutamate synthase PgsB/CapB